LQDAHIVLEVVSLEHFKVIQVLPLIVIKGYLEFNQGEVQQGGLELPARLLDEHEAAEAHIVDQAGTLRLLVSLGDSLVVREVVKGYQQALSVAIEDALGPHFDLNLFYFELSGASSHRSDLVPAATENGKFAHPRVEVSTQVNNVCELLEVIGEVIEE